MDDLALVRQLLENEYSFLNEHQREAVFQLNGPLLVLAGAGSGKTSVLTNRIAYMLRYGNAYHEGSAAPFTQGQREHLQRCLETGMDDAAKDLVANKPVSPYQVLAITFTNKAAGEMKERVEKLAGSAGSGVWVSTFHAACCRILRRDIEKLGYGNSFTIYDADDQLTVIKEALKAANLSDKDYPPREIRAIISKAKTLMQTPDEFFQSSSRDFRSQKLSELYADYEKHLKKNNALDFDDLLIKTLQLFADHPPVLEYYAERFKYILVDEYQDTNHVQYMFVRLLAGRHKNLCVVGDDDQSIYGWRGADISNILDFEKDYKNCKTIKLEQNYRSTNIILSAANAVIGNNTARKAKSLWSSREGGNPIGVVKLTDEQDEASYIAGEILRLREGGVPLHEMAVLYRTNAQSRVLEERLVFASIPYSIYGGLRFYERKEIKDVVAYLRLCVNPNDDVAFRRVINEPKRGIGDATIETLVAWATQSGDSLFGAAMDVAQVETLSARAKQAVMRFADLMTELMAYKELLPVSEFTQKLIELTGIQKQYEKDDEDAQARFQNIGELLSAMLEYEAGVENPSIEGFLEEAALVSDIDGLKEDSGRVTLMTMHSAKGLEFGTVFVAGMEDGLFPGNRAFFEQEKMEEERRLCYVAITRAKNDLYLCFAGRRMLYGNPQNFKPSRFLSELPPELISEQDRSFKRKTPERPSGGAQAPRVYVRGGMEPSPLRKEEKPQQKNEYANGDKVEHRRYGEGTVVRADGNIVRVAFPGQGIKEFDVRFAPMTKQ